MRELLIILSLSITVSSPLAWGEITPKVYESNGEIPFDFNDSIMVGTKLTIILISDSNSYWSGGLFITDQDRAMGTLVGRGLDPNDPNTRDYVDSHCESAGDFAKVTAWEDSYMWGFDLYTFYPVDGNSDNNSTVPGEWFIIDYEADEVGTCNVGFYDYSVSWSDANYFLSFSHSPTRDLSSDGKVDFTDFATFALQWDASECSEPNWCDGADLDRDGDVDPNDLGLFTEYWLWGASGGNPNDSNEPNEGCQGDPNVTYSIVDINDSNEITMGVNESITLYVRMVTTEENNVQMFDIEVNISDTNLGAIDNTPIGSNDPLPTAQILAEPRLECFDYWGPGARQEEGIEFFAMTLDSPISDGNLASFVFTCEGEGDVTLELINWHSYNTNSEDVCPKLESIVIHQIDPNSQQMMGMGGGEDEMFGIQETAQPQSLQEINVDEIETTQQADVDEIVRFLEDLWLQDDAIREICSEAKWEEFIEDIKNSSGQF